MLDKDFFNIVHKLISDMGLDILFDSKFKAFITDYSQNDFKHEVKCLLYAVQDGYAEIFIKSTDDFAKDRLLQSLNNDPFLKEEAVNFIADLLDDVKPKPPEPEPLTVSVPATVTAQSLSPDPLKDLREKAKEGDANAQCELGLAYYLGQRIEQNQVLAAEWFRKAAEQGLAEAQFKLGMCYFKGKGVHKNKGEAIAWFSKAGMQGHSEAKSKFDKLSPPQLPLSPPNPLQTLIDKANQGDADAQYKLGMAYYRGNSIKQDKFKSFELLRKSAEQGYADAQYELGIGYYLDKNFTESVKWFYRSAVRGNDESLEWYNKLVNHSKIKRQYHQKKIIGTKIQEQNNEKTSLQDLINKAKEGDANAQYELQVRTGRGV